MSIYDSLKERFRDFPKLHEVEDFVVNLSREMDPLLIVMFGALTRGDYIYNSDIDVLLIFEEPVTWNEVFAFSKGVVQPIAKTKDNFEVHLKKGNAFFIQILEEGIILYSKPGVLEYFKKIAHTTINSLKMNRVEKGWGEI